MTLVAKDESFGRGLRHRPRCSNTVGEMADNDDGVDRVELRGNTTGGRRCWSWDGEVMVLFSQTPEGLDLPLDVFFKNISGEASVLCPEVKQWRTYNSFRKLAADSGLSAFSLHFLSALKTVTARTSVILKLSIEGPSASISGFMMVHLKLLTN